MIRRRCGESIFVGDNVEIQVLEVAGGRVKLGISAPREILVLRSELKQTEEFNRQASRAASPEQLVSLASRMQSARRVTGRS